MYDHEYKLGLKVTAITDRYEREAIQAEQRRMAKNGRPGRLTSVIAILRTSINPHAIVAEKQKVSSPVSRHTLAETAVTA